MIKSKKENLGYLSPLWKALLIIIPTVTVIVSVGIGWISISPSDVVKSLWDKLIGGDGISATLEKVLWDFRLPRVILAFLCGAGLSVAGCCFQSLFSNPLATPDTLGVASGASFGAALGMLMGIGFIWVQLTSLAFGILAVMLTWLAGSGKGRGMSSIVLAGIMISSLFSSLVSLVKVLADTESELPAITYWLMGSLSSASYKRLLIGAPLIILGVLVIYLIRWRLNILPLGEDEARASGTNIKLLRALTMICATAITASCVSMCGQVGWVGLLIPHICRMKFGNNHLSIIPASIAVGGTFLVIVDTLARTIAEHMPISVLTAIIGAPFFIVLMRRSGGWSL